MIGMINANEQDNKVATIPSKSEEANHDDNDKGEDDDDEYEEIRNLREEYGHHWLEEESVRQALKWQFGAKETKLDSRTAMKMAEIFSELQFFMHFTNIAGVN